MEISSRVKEIVSGYRTGCVKCGGRIGVGDRAYWMPKHLWCERCPPTETMVVRGLRRRSKF